MDTKCVWLESSAAYHLEEEKWSEGPNLPSLIFWPSALTDINGTFSLVIGSKINGVTSEIFMFDEETKFKKIAEIDLYCRGKFILTSI